MRTGSSFADAYSIYVPLRFARQILDTDGAHRLLLFLRHERDLDAAQERLHRRISQIGLPLSVSNWREVQEFYDQLKSFYDLLFRFAIVVVTLLSMVAIFAMISVSFLERLRELGSLRAIGTTRGQLLLLLLVESLTTYLLGAAAALGLGLAAGAAINALGITFVPIGSNLAVPFYIDLELRYFLVPRHHHAADDRRRHAGSHAAYRSPQHRVRPASRLKRSRVPWECRRTGVQQGEEPAATPTAAMALKDRSVTTRGRAVATRRRCWRGPLRLPRTGRRRWPRGRGTGGR